MGTFLRYLISLGIQLAWQRSGRSGATPPIRMPFGRNKGKSMPLPIIGPWQMMAAMWIIRRIWSMYGHQIKDRLGSTGNPLVGHLRDLLPDTPGAPASSASTPSTSTPSSGAQQATAQPTGSQQASPPPPPAARPAPQYRTQPLSSAANTNSTSPTDTAPLPSGSVLNGRRGTSYVST